jgi:hypothetical protein
MMKDSDGKLRLVGSAALERQGNIKWSQVGLLALSWMIHPDH